MRTDDVCHVSFCHTDVKAMHAALPFISRDRILLLEHSYEYPLCSTMRPALIRLHGRYAVCNAEIKVSSYDDIVY